MKIHLGHAMAGIAACLCASACQSTRSQGEAVVHAMVQQGQPAGAGQPTTRPGDNADIETARERALRDIEGGQTAPESTAGPEPIDASGRRPAFSLNPDITVFVDGVGTWSPDRSNDFYNRFDIREAELDLRAAVHPRADGVLILAFHRDIHNELFEHHDEEEEEEDHGLETSVNIEEGYLFIHDLGIPNLTAKIGRFHLRFGRQNLLHQHDLPTTDPAFVNQAFLAPEALVDSGVSFSYLIPPRFVAGQYVEVVAEVVMGEGGDSESPIFEGDFTVDSPAVNLHALWNTDLGNDLNLELGSSYLVGHRTADNALDAQVFGVDVTLMRTDPTGGFRNTMLQAETMYGIVDTEDEGRQYALGAYLLGQQQLNRDWYAGLRLDWTQNPVEDTQEVWGVTPYVSWYWSEFLRFRLGYQHRDGDREAEDVVWFQTTFVFGAHPPHPYWAMR